MTISYHSGERIQGTSTDFAPIPAISGGWKEVGRTTLGSASSTITVSISSPKQYYMVLCPIKADASGGTDSNWRFNGDTSTNYAWSFYYQGQTNDYGTGSQTKIYDNGSGGSRFQFAVMYIANTSGKRKLTITKNAINWTSGTTGEVGRKNIYGKWDNANDAINSIQLYFSDGGAQSGDEVVVLGWDEDDTHTDNFWEELASVTATGSTTSFNSGTFTAKKYLWVQGYFTSSGAFTPQIRVGNNTIDSSGNYVGRRSYDGGSDVLTTQQTEITLDGVGQSTPVFFNGFIVNRASDEKLAIFNCVKQNTAGAGNAPHRRETVFKWVDTTNQINIIEFLASTGNIGSTGTMKIWGHD